MPFGKKVAKSTKKSDKKDDSGGGFLGKAYHAAKHEVEREAKIVSKGSKDIVRSAKEDITGFPTAGYTYGKAYTKAIGGDPRDLLKLNKEIGKQTYTSVRHPVRGYQQDPFGEILTALGIASLGIGAIARGGAGLSAAGQGESVLKAVGRKPVYKRTIDIRKAPMEIERKSSTGKPLKTKVKKVTVEASPNPVARVARKGVEKTVGKTTRYQKRASKKQSMLHNLNVKRLEQGNAPVARAQGLASGATAIPMDVMRASMYLRPRTAVQNAIQTQMMLQSQGGPLGVLRSARQFRGLKKVAPDVAENMRAMVGESAARSLAQGGVSRGPLGNIVMRLAELANKPEAMQRPLSAMYEARRRGIDTPEKLREVFENPHSPEYQRFATASNEAAGDFGRLSPKERDFMKSQIPIFYPMFKALTRYGAKFPTEHSAQAAALAQAGRQGKEIQREALGNLPWWANYMVPGKKENEVYNPSNIYNLQPGLDIATQLGEMVRAGGDRPGMTLLQEAAPLPALVYSATTGKELGSDFPLRGMSPKTNDLGSRRSAWATLKDQWEQTLPGQAVAALHQNEIPLGPGSRLATNDTPTKSYQPSSLEEWLALQALGPSFVSRGIRPSQLHKQYKRQESYGRSKHGKRGRRRHKKSAF